MFFIDITLRLVITYLLVELSWNLKGTAGVLSTTAHQTLLLINKSTIQTFLINRSLVDVGK